MSLWNHRRHASGNSRRSLNNALHSMGDAASVPDFTEAILARVDQRRPFLNRYGRLAVTITRAVSGLVIVGLVTAIILVQSSIGETRFGPSHPDPLSAVVRGAADDATRGLASISSARLAVAGMVAPQSAPQPQGISPGAAAAYFWLQSISLPRVVNVANSSQGADAGIKSVADRWKAATRPPTCAPDAPEVHADDDAPMSSSEVLMLGTPR